MAIPQNSSYSTELVGKLSTDRLTKPEKSAGKAKNRVKITTQETEKNIYLIALNSFKIYEAPKENFFDKLVALLGLRTWIYIPLASSDEKTTTYVRVNKESLRKRFNFSKGQIQAIKSEPDHFNSIIEMRLLTMPELKTRADELKQQLDNLMQRPEEITVDEYLELAEKMLLFSGESSRRFSEK